MDTSKYLKLSSWGTALIPGTLHKNKSVPVGRERNILAYGSAINLSVSLMIRFGSAAIVADVAALQLLKNDAT